MHLKQFLDHLSFYLVGRRLFIDIYKFHETLKNYNSKSFTIRSVFALHDYIFFSILNSDNGKQINLEAKFLLLRTNRHRYFSPSTFMAIEKPTYVHNKHMDKQGDTKPLLLLRINKRNPAPLQY